MESWKEIKDFPNYQISSLGRVKNKYDKILKNQLNNRGYYTIMLYNNYNYKLYSIHRLIAIYFIPNPDILPIVDHINRNRIDNSLENLRWVNQPENAQNVSLQKNNVLREQYIHKNNNGFMFERKINGIRYLKWFKNLSEAIEYRNDFLDKLLNR